MKIIKRKITPGPWGTGLLKRAYYVHGLVYTVKDSRGRLLAAMYSPHEGLNPKTRNNASMMALAPEMSEALVKVDKLLDIYAGSSEPSLNGSGVDAEIRKQIKSILSNLKRNTDAVR